MPMKCQEFDLNHALGVKIFEEIRLDGMVLEKGHTLNEEDIIQLKLSGIATVYGWKRRSASSRPNSAAKIPLMSSAATVFAR